MNLGDAETADFRGETTGIKKWAPTLVGLSILLVFGISIPWAVWNAMRQRYDAVFVVLGSIMIVAVTFTLFFGDVTSGGLFSHNAGTSAPWHTTAWTVYGESAASAAHYPSQTVSYEVVRGWALAGALLFFRFIDWGFTSLIIPLIGFGGVLYAVRLSQRERSVRPIAVHGMLLLILFPLLVLPVVRLETPADGNPVYMMIADQVDANTGAPPDEPRVTPLVAGAFNVLTDLSERAGSKISFGTKEPHSIIFQAGNDAKLDDGDFDTYMTFAGTCMTAIKSISAVQKQDYREEQWEEFFNRVLGNDGREGGGTLGRFNSAKIHMKYALSPYADAMFYGVSPIEWVFFDDDDNDEYQRFDGMYAVMGFPKEFTYHPNPQIGTGEIAVKHWDSDSQEIKEEDGILDFEKDVTVYSQMGLRPGVESYSDMAEGVVNGETENYMPYCSLNTLDRNIAAQYSELSSPDMLPESFKQQKKIEHNWRSYRPADWGDTVRHRIAMRYFGPGSIEFCKSVSPDRQSSHIWGCLIANKYDSEATPQEAAMKEVQEAFNTIYRPRLNAEIAAAQVAAGSYTHARDADSSGYARPDYEQTVWDMRKERHFVDAFFMAPGVQAQIGMFGDHRGQDLGLARDSNWFVRTIFSLGGYCAPTVAGVFAWIAAIIAKIALMIYPHVLGLMTFFLIIMAIPYLVRGLLPGQYFVPLEWVKAVAVVCLIPFYAQFGLALIEQGNSMGTLSMFIRVSAGGDIGEAICNLFGAGIIISSLSLAAATVALGFGTLAGMLAAINSNAFKLTGAGAAGIMMVTGIGAVAGAKVMGAAMAAKMLGTAAAGAKTAADKSTSDASKQQVPSGGLPTGSQPARIGGGGGGGGAPTTSGSGIPRQTVHNGTESRAIEAKQAFDQASEVQAKAMASRVGDSLADVGKQGLDAGLAAATATAQSMDMGSPSAGALMAGAAAGGSVGAKVSGATTSAARSVSSMKDLRKYYQNRRNQRGELLDSVPPNPDAAQKFKAVGDSLEDDAKNAWQGNDRTGSIEAYRQAGVMLRDAAHLENEPKAAGETALRSANDFFQAGDYENAERQLLVAERNAVAMEQRALTPRERADALVLSASGAYVGMRMAQGRGDFQKAEASLGMVDDRLRRADALYQQDAGQRFTEAQAGTAGSWNAYASTMMARSRAIQLGGEAFKEAERPAGYKPDDFTGTQLQGLRAAADSGDPRANLVMGAVLAGSGRDGQAQQYFSRSGVDVSAEDAKKLRQDLAAGRTNTLDTLLGRIDRR